MNESQNRLTARQFGQSAEAAVADYFIRQGHTVVAQNYSAANLGELDLVLAQADLLTIVEVKARRSGIYGGPAAAISRTKRQKLQRTALHFMQHHGLMNNRVQFLAALVQIDQTGNCLSISVVPFNLT
ncbi:MAG: YraN family protein [Bacillota bacterium]|nr:YraN family protein [Bacillota bacterium]